MSELRSAKCSPSDMHQLQLTLPITAYHSLANEKIVSFISFQLLIAHMIILLLYRFCPEDTVQGVVAI